MILTTHLFKFLQCEFIILYNINDVEILFETSSIRKDPEVYLTAREAHMFPFKPVSYHIAINFSETTGQN